jgi:hypothetical protein
LHYSKKGRCAIWYYNKFILQILAYYRDFYLLYDTFAIGFTGVANERPAAANTDTVSEDVLYFGGQIDANGAGSLVRIRSTTPQYEWMANVTAIPQDTPASAIFGLSTQAMPVMPWVMPFFVEQQGRLQFQFTNSAGATGGIVTLHGLRLTNPINGTGWNYQIGFTA